jgi:arginase
MVSVAHNSFCELGHDVISSTRMMDDIIADECNSDFKSIADSIDSRIKTIHEQGGFPLILGGDHSITYPICKTIRKYRSKPFVIVHFDAHPDLYPDFEGNPSSHASPFVRILEEHGKGNRICKGLYQIGIRTTNDIQRQMMDKFNVRVCEARNFPPSREYPSIAAFYSGITPEDDVYISLDMDCLDPAFAPGVSHREPGGLTTRQLIDCIHAIPGNVIGADIVEYNPSRDLPGYFTATCAAKLAKEILGKMGSSR